MQIISALIYGIPDFSYTDVTFSQQADIDCALRKIVPLSHMQGQPDTPKASPQSKVPIEPRIWYENQGRTVLENLIADLNSRGHNSITSKENDEISIQRADQEVKQAALKNVPEKTYWIRLTKVFQSEGLAAKITNDGIVVTW